MRSTPLVPARSRPAHLHKGSRRLRRTVVGLTIAALAGAPAALVTTGAADAASTVAVQSVTYHGITLSVPSGWPVYRLADDPSLCVRFDVHAVYLGSPSSDETCPAQPTGQTGAVLVEPVSTSAVDQALPDLSPADVDDEPVGVSAPTSVQTSYTLVSPQAHAEVVVTAGTDPATRAGIVSSLRIGSAASASGSLSQTGPTAIPRPLDRSRSAATAGTSRATTTTTAYVTSAPSATPSTSATTDAAPAVTDAATSASGPAVYEGEGFDTCAAPSAAQMSDWLASPYRAVGIYLGGDEAACAQPNLTADWVSEAAAEGWHFVPTYVGPQASCADASFSDVISAASATSEGEQSAESAAALASALGLGAGNPIYYDMEAYDNGDASCNIAVLDYLQGWTQELNALGYQSGVYSSASSGITALVGQADNDGYTEPDDVWIADWNDSETTTDPSVPAGDWDEGQRIHQYSGDATQRYDGVSISLDGDYSDALLADPGNEADTPTATPSRVTYVAVGTAGGGLAAKLIEAGLPIYAKVSGGYVRGTSPAKFPSRSNIYAISEAGAVSTDPSSYRFVGDAGSGLAAASTRAGIPIYTKSGSTYERVTNIADAATGQALYEGAS